MNPKDRAGSAKPNLSIVPLRPLYEVALALYEGARKYGPWNWRKENVDEVIYVDAAIRHMNQWLAGEDIDPDSGLPHISKAIAGLIILRDAQHHECSIDTRRAPQNIDLVYIASMMTQIDERYPVAVEDKPTQYPPITADDVDRTVTFTDGSTGIIIDWDSHDKNVPVKIEFDDSREAKYEGYNWYSTLGTRDSADEPNATDGPIQVETVER
jgi:hypothetical protein